jgi:N-acetylglutamate synthase-like GNAT family acetyltransferase
MNPESEDFFVSTDQALLDLDLVCAMLKGSYWAQHRSRATIERSIKNSLCFGIYERKSKKQAGFARVVTDKATFCWLCDVIIDEAQRKKGLGKLLMASVVAHPWVKVSVCLLGTADAHGLYEKYGFRKSEQMKRPPG